MKNLLHRIKNRKNLRIGIKIWLFFMLFVCVVFFLMWIFQVLFLEVFYETAKIRDTTKISKQLETAYAQDKFEDLADELAMKNETCVLLLDTDYNEVYSTCMYNNRCLIHDTHMNDTYFYLLDMENSDDHIICRKVKNDVLQSDMLVYGTIIYDSDNEIEGYLILNTALIPVQGTISILKRQTMTITGILICVGFILSLLIANYISEPIVRITHQSKKLAHGEYTPNFEGGGYAEIDDLAATLNATAVELSKTESMQRDLIANMSHDLRTPLTMVKAYAEMVRDLSGDNPKKRNQHLGVIIEETDRLSLLVNDMLDLSKLESGTQKLEYTTFDIADMMQEIVHRYSGISEQMGYTISLESDGPCMVTCDEGKINRVVGNLINNAINYTSKEDKQIFVAQRNLPEGVRIEVRDTGDGIEEDKIKLIFDKYYRSENHKREVVGSGLGLSIVKEILKLHGYDYGVQSQLGVGSTFWFTIRPTPPTSPKQ